MGDDDPLARLPLDDEFVRGAELQEPAADEGDVQQLAVEREDRRARRGSRWVPVGAVVIVAALIGWFVLFDGDGGSGAGDLAGGTDADEPTETMVAPAPPTRAASPRLASAQRRAAGRTPGCAGTAGDGVRLVPVQRSSTAVDRAGGVRPVPSNPRRAQPERSASRGADPARPGAPGPEPGHGPAVHRGRRDRRGPRTARPQERSAPAIWRPLGAGARRLVRRGCGARSRRGRGRRRRGQLGGR